MRSVAIHSPAGCRPGEDVGDRLYDRIMSRPHRVLLVDDDDMVRTGLRAILMAAGDIDVVGEAADGDEVVPAVLRHAPEDRKSTRLNSSHVAISYAVFCLKKEIL